MFYDLIYKYHIIGIISIFASKLLTETLLGVKDPNIPYARNRVGTRRQKKK